MQRSWLTRGTQKELAEAMRSVLTDLDLEAQLRAKGPAGAQQFTWERTARETVKVYQKVLACWS